jgi:hypothetical protein
VSTTILNGIFPWMMRRGVGIRGHEASSADASKRYRETGWYRVKVDMDRIRSHVAQGSPGIADDRSLRRWLRQSGFEQRGNWWVVRESGLGQLAPSEVAASERMDD